MSAASGAPDPLRPADDITIRPIGRDGAAALEALHRACPIEADFTFRFDRGRDFFAWPDAVFDAHHYLGAYRGAQLVGAGMVGVGSGRMGDEIDRWRYLGDGRVLREARGARLGERLAQHALAALPDDARLFWGLVKQGNLPAEQTARTTVVPRFAIEPLCDFEAANVLLLWRIAAPQRCAVRRAAPQDAEALADLFARATRGRLLAPTLTAEAMSRDAATRGAAYRTYVAERSGRLVGTLSTWDMSALHSTILMRYSTRGQIIRAAYSAARMLLHSAAPLPAPGAPFRTLTATRVAVADDDPAVMRDLLAAAINDHVGRGYHMLHVGFTAGDPLRPSTRGLAVQRFRSSIFVGVDRRLGSASTLPGAKRVYVDLAII